MIKYLKADNWEGCSVFLTEQDNRIWVGACTDDNYAVAYVDAKQLYEELKEFFEKEKS